MNFYEFEQILEQAKERRVPVEKDRSLRWVDEKPRLLFWNKHPRGSKEYELAKKKGDRLRRAAKISRTGKSAEEIRQEEEKEIERKKAIAAKRK